MADIGILNNDDEGGEEERPRVSSRFDVYNALTSAEHRGGCYSSDRADGTTTPPALPSLLGLHIDGVGKLSLPLSDDNNKAIKEKAQLIEDDKYNNIFQIQSDDVTIKNPAYDVALQKLVKHVAYKLGVNPSNISANLEMLLHMEEGSCIDWTNEERDDEEGGDVFGTLLVQLPSSFTGGGFSIIREGEEDGSCITFSMGGGDNGDAEFGLHYLCKYTESQYKMETLESGSRIILKYSLRYESDHDERHTLAMLRSSMLPLEQSMAFLPPLERIVLIPLLKEYDVSSLMMNGINELSYEHRAKAEAVKAGRKGDWKVLIVNTKMVHSYPDSYETMINFTTKTTVLHMIDEDGNDVTKSMKWLEEITDFDSVVTQSTGNQMGMMLSTRPDADPYDEYNEYGPPCHFPNEWGEATKKDTVSCCCYNGKEYCSTHNDDNDSTTYTASFILAYDQASAEPELICLSGIKGVTTISERVVSTEDFGLLERMLSVVETNKKSKFDKKSCCSLLTMMNKSNVQRTTIIGAVNKVLLGLSTHSEPDDNLCSTILSSVDIFGWKELSESVKKLITDSARKKSGKKKTLIKKTTKKSVTKHISRVGLSNFLRRVSFILSIERSSSDCSQSEAASLISGCISDLARSDCRDTTNLSTSNVVKVDGLVETYGWKSVSNVFEASLAFLWKLKSTLPISTLLIVAELLMKLHTAKHDMNSHFKNFAINFASGVTHEIRPSSVTALSGYLTGRQEALFLKSIRLLLQYGEEKEYDAFGKVAASKEDILTKIVTSIATCIDGVDNQDILLGMLNKCLIQHSVPEKNWAKDKRLVIPSQHIRQIIAARPTICNETDEVTGRLPLHYAVARSGITSRNISEILNENKDAASMIDPVFNLYPFMAAGRNGNVSASFSLLLTNPSLILNTTQSNTDGRKRKRDNSETGNAESEVKYNREMDIVKHIQVLGCGTAEVNGTYTITNKLNEGCPIYRKKGQYEGKTVDYILFCRSYGAAKYWNVGIAGKAIFFYRSANGVRSNDTFLPPMVSSGWVAKDEGESPTPDLVYLSSASAYYLPVGWVDREGGDNR